MRSESYGVLYGGNLRVRVRVRVRVIVRASRCKVWGWPWTYVTFILLEASFQK